MIKRLSLSLTVATTLTLLLASCTLSHLFVPQKDIESRELNRPSMEEQVLLASRSSVFKDAVVNGIEKAFAGRPVYVKLIGLDELEDEDAAQYAAVVLINTCMFWQLDPEVKEFLDRHEDLDNLIVLTTSGEGYWLPDREGRDFDALSSASHTCDVEDLSQDIVNMSDRRLQGE